MPLAIIQGVSAGEAPASVIELPYRVFENPSREQIVLIGSAHGPIAGIQDISLSTKGLLGSVSLVAFEGLPDGPRRTNDHPTVQSYVDRETLRRLEEATKPFPEFGPIWVVVKSVPMTADTAGELFLVTRCRADEIRRRVGGSSSPMTKSVDRLIAEAAPSKVELVELETEAERRALYDEVFMREASAVFEARVSAAISGEVCPAFVANFPRVSSLLLARRIREIFDHLRSYECANFACHGLLSGIAFSKARNQNWVRRLQQVVQGRGRIAAVVGAAHLDDRAGLFGELISLGFREISSNLVEGPL